MLYNIAMIQYHSRCVIRQLLWLWSTYPNVLLRLGFYMFSLQELCANWLLRQAPDRGAPGAREHITRETPDNRLRHILLGPWGILMYKVFPRNLYSTECHTSSVFVIAPLTDIKPRSHLSGSRPGWSRAHPWYIRGDLGRSGVIQVYPWPVRARARIIKMFNTSSSCTEPIPGLHRIVRESSREVRGSSVKCWLWTSHGLAPDYSRMSPGIPGRVTAEHGWPTDKHRLATDGPGLA